MTTHPCASSVIQKKMLAELLASNLSFELDWLDFSNCQITCMVRNDEKKLLLFLTNKNKIENIG